MVKCNSCSYEGENVTVFQCSKCAEKLVRCNKCKTLSVKYNCIKCGFQGP